MAGKMRGTPAERCEWVFQCPMNPCPSCGGYDLISQVPIVIEELPDDATVRQMMGTWARARKSGTTPLIGTAFITCKSCGHNGPSYDVSGRTAEDVGRDLVVSTEIKRLWNTQ